jgi:hypothetical protein
MHIGRLRSSAGGRDGGGGALWRRAVAQDDELAGAIAIRRCGALKAARTAPKRPGAHGEPHGGHPERRRRGAAVARRATEAAELGEDGPTARCTSAQTSDTRGSLTERRFHRAAPKRRTGGETAANGRNRSGGVHGGGQLGLGG